MYALVFSTEYLRWGFPSKQSIHTSEKMLEDRRSSESPKPNALLLIIIQV